jgi:hypothetical protein
MCHVVALIACGCGAIGNTTYKRNDIPADICPGAATEKTTAADAILLDWSGGVSRIYPGEQLAGLDLSLFLVTDGTTLLDEADDFKTAVRDEVSRILCDMPTDGVYLTNSKSGLPRQVTTVYLSQFAPPLGGAQIGQGEYDPCNLEHDNQAIIFGDEILALGDERSFDEWVLVLANVTAHEIGHTLGYGHVPRVMVPAAQQPEFVELMMATHTVDEMKRAQRLLSDESNCPDAGDAPAPSRRDRTTTLTCSHQ